MSVVASLLIDFGSDSSAFLAVELDSELNGGRTTFKGGDSVYFKVYSNCDYEVYCTEGSVSKITSNVSEDVDPKEIIQFVNSKVSNTSKKIASITSVTWFGTDLGSISATGEANPTEIQAANATVNNFGVCQIEYKSIYDSWKLQAPGSLPAVYSILVLIKAI